jgi:hypothetical protein
MGGVVGSRGLFFATGFDVSFRPLPGLMTVHFFSSRGLLPFGKFRAGNELFPSLTYSTI